MADINIKIGQKQEPEGPVKAKLNVRRTLDGNILVMDHDHIDIIITKERKLTAFAKDKMCYEVEQAQKSLMDYMASKGAIDRDSVQGGNVYHSVEAQIPESEDINASQAAVLLIAKWMEEQKPHMEMEKYYKERGEKRLTEPEDEESTELGEIPHEAEKGSIEPSRIRRYLSGYGFY